MVASVPPSPIEAFFFSLSTPLSPLLLCCLQGPLELLGLAKSLASLLPCFGLGEKDPFAILTDSLYESAAVCINVIDDGPA